MKQALAAAIVLFAIGAIAQDETKFTLTSTAFTNGGEIPVKYTCQGENISPPLAWKNLPAGTKSLVLIVEDYDAPDPKAPKMVWDHWLLYNLPPSAGGLPEGVKSKDLPQGTREALNSWKKTGYGGPCPPIGRHRYFHRLYALDLVLADLKTPDKQTLLKAMEGHILGQVELIGTYQKR